MYKMFTKIYLLYHLTRDIKNTSLPKSTMSYFAPGLVNMDKKCKIFQKTEKSCREPAEEGFR